ncbi:HAD-superfamily hydrolase subfamily IA [Paenibacillus sp. IHB B 3415]|uniref:acylneuraminate cytidylyltransferase family protein n=1 Tax=Paenibacillus sp. IHB B 3415 TaxID=867080 RepID=UPI0005756D4D|nr:NTP transferase domain-containing protein [Paenibacillus sp. IHB B 3415]KHL96002.1 HAD-superfamily hydrolase subfamily IA [Paenibacillus sp. IHB B 3415]
MSNRKVVAFVPIKLNSQRLPHKNILPIAGRPLCWHIVDTLCNVDGIDEIYVFCSDEEVKNYIPSEAKFLKRDQKLDGDMVKGFEIYEAFTNQVDADIYVLAHTTSPFIKTESISNSLNYILNKGNDSAFSAQKIQTFAWYKGEPINYDLNDVPRTQDMEPIYVETSAFFMFEKELFTKYRRRIGFNPYIQEVDSIEAVDIDTKEDYDFALRLIQDK